MNDVILQHQQPTQTRFCQVQLVINEYTTLKLTMCEVAHSESACLPSQAKAGSDFTLGVRLCLIYFPH